MIIIVMIIIIIVKKKIILLPVQYTVYVIKFCLGFFLPPHSTLSSLSSSFYVLRILILN